MNHIYMCTLAEEELFRVRDRVYGRGGEDLSEDDAVLLLLLLRGFSFLFFPKVLTTANISFSLIFQIFHKDGDKIRQM